MHPESDGVGLSIGRINGSAYGDDPANWRTSTKTPGAPLAPVAPTGPVAPVRPVAPVAPTVAVAAPVEAATMIPFT